MRKLRAVVVVIAAMGITVAGTAFVLGRNGSHGAATKAVAARSGARAEGVKVHGHWTIDVRNPDGSLASHTDFENALVAGEGDAALSLLLARQRSVYRWEIATATNDGLQCQWSFGLAACVLDEPPDGDLTITAPTTGDNANKLVFTGHFTAGTDGSINRVDTLIQLCLPAYYPGQNCQAFQGGPNVLLVKAFTSKTLNSDVHVTTGQQVALTVVISFS